MDLALAALRGELLWQKQDVARSKVAVTKLDRVAPLVTISNIYPFQLYCPNFHTNDTNDTNRDLTDEKADLPF